MDKEEIIKQCLNCGHELTDNYCPHCGQNAQTKRLKLKEILSDLVNSIIGGDNKFLNTLKGLACRPGHLVREYLQGHRNIYYNPIQLLIWIITIYAILAFIVGYDPFEVVDNNVEVESKSKNDAIQFIWVYIDKCWDFISGNKLYYTFLTDILVVFPFVYVFRKQPIKRPDGSTLPLNYTEHFYTLIYASCLEMTVSIILLPFSLINGIEDFVKYINDYIGYILYIIIYKQLYGISWWKSIRNVIISAALVILYLFTIIVIVGILIAIVAVIYAIITKKMTLDDLAFFDFVGTNPFKGHFNGFDCTVWGEF